MDSKYTMEERGNNYTLTISEVRQTDLGDYTCTAVNKISEQQAQVVLTGKQNYEKYFQFCQTFIKRQITSLHCLPKKS